jgi:hypothetical protein
MHVLFTFIISKYIFSFECRKFGGCWQLHRDCKRCDHGDPAQVVPGRGPGDGRNGVCVMVVVVGGGGARAPLPLGNTRLLQTIIYVYCEGSYWCYINIAP